MTNPYFDISRTPEVLAVGFVRSDYDGYRIDVRLHKNGNLPATRNNVTVIIKHMQTMVPSIPSFAYGGCKGDR